MQDIILKVLDGSDDIIGTTLRLTKKSDSNYYCKETGIEIIDTWDELQKIKLVSRSNMKLKFDVLLFINSTNSNPSFISKVQRTNLKRIKVKKRILQSIFRFVSNNTEKIAFGA